MEFTIANNAHACVRNAKHRLERGMPRLTIRDDGEERHYCLQCARALLADGVAHLQLLLAGASRLAGQKCE